MTHPWLAWQSTDRIRQELTDCNALLEDTLGIPIRYFRAPHGDRGPGSSRHHAKPATQPRLQHCPPRRRTERSRPIPPPHRRGHQAAAA
jgi:hypothetical protein